MTITEPCGCATATNSQLEAAEAGGHAQAGLSSHYCCYPPAFAPISSLSLPHSVLQNASLCSALWTLLTQTFEESFTKEFHDVQNHCIRIMCIEWKSGRVY